MSILLTDEQAEEERQARKADMKRDRADRFRAMTEERAQVASRLEGAKANQAGATTRAATANPGDRGYFDLVKAKADADLAVVKLTARLAHIDETLKEAKR